MKTIPTFCSGNKLARLIPVISILFFSNLTFATEFFDNFENVNVNPVATFELTHNGITATVAGGTAFQIGNGALYHSGVKSWMVEPVGFNIRGTHTGEGTITFSESMSRISFWVRSDFATVISTVTLLDVDGNQAEGSRKTTVLDTAWTEVNFTIIDGSPPLKSILFVVAGTGMAALDDLGGTSIEDTGGGNTESSGGGGNISIYLLLTLSIVWAIRRRYPLQF